MDTKQAGRSERRETLEGLWSTRPIRPANGRTVAGVCVGIGNRYRVDPTLVKVAFVVAAMFGGSGILVYIAAWLVLPSQRRLAGAATQAATAQWYADHAHLHYDQWRREHTHLQIPALDGLARHGLRRGHVIGLIILAIIAASSFGPNSTWSSSGLVGAALLAIGWWLLHRRTPVPPPGTSVDTYQQAFTQAITTGTTVAGSPTSGAEFIPGAPTAGPPPLAAHMPTATPADHIDLSKSGSFAAEPPATTTAIPPVAQPVPPAWDPLGTARFAWDLPEPRPQAEVVTQPRRRSPFTLVVVGAAVLTATGASAAAVAGVEWFTPARIASLTLAVLGVGLVIGGLHRTTGKHAPGLVPLAILAAAAVVGLSSAADISVPSGGVGERVWAPTSETGLDESYSLSVGSQILDLRSITLTRDRKVNVDTGIGETVIRVPATMAVDSTCEAGIGSVKCPTGRSGPANSPVLQLTAHTGMGEVRLTRE
ncbi:PspC domain-containing protein [Gordonia sp. CPCC 205333]|uniref:PspC domain-containing protein n=1 Tax=Gordonia sp. CPCC 205333 TaxID=3140790 RepID=UPI003AF364FE